MRHPLWTIDLNPSAVASLIEELAEALGEIHDLAGNALNVPEGKSAQAVDRLLYFAKTVAYGLFGEHPGPLYRAAGTRAIGALNPDRPPRVIEVKSPQRFFFPFELLRWQDDPEGGLPGEPAIRARLILGMSALIRRQVCETPEAQGPLPNGSGLPVTVFQHPGLPAARAEVDYLKASGDLVNVYGSWPVDRALAQMAAVQHIIDSTVPMDSQPWTGPATVLHLACHCVTTGANDRHRYVNVGGDNGCVTLSELKNEVAGKASANVRPLVFLNACRSAAPQAVDRGAFAEFMLAVRFRGVVGTLFDISDVVAAHFARVFYQALLSGRTVGEAMYDARWHLMEVHGNPLGLLYSFHGNVDLTVSDPHAGQVEPACKESRQQLVSE
jgi:hypothetical protein